MKKYILLLAFIPTLLHAQNNGDSLKFEIIRVSINFLSTDKESFKESSGRPTTCEFSDGYACLKSYCTDNKLHGAGDKLDVWKKEPSSSLEELLKLKEKIFVELTTGSDAKTRRLNLPGFAYFQKSINQSVTEFHKSEIHATESGLDTVLDDTTKEISSPAETTSENESEKSKDKLPITALILSVLALVVGVLSLKRNKGDSSGGQNAQQGDSNLEKQLHVLKSQFSQMQGVDLRPLESIVKNLESRISNLENQLQLVQLPVEKIADANTQRNTTIATAQIFYAKLPDTGNGFGNSILTKEQNGEQIYEIEIRDGKGSFSISGDANAQKYALSDFNYYLSSACDFLNQPVKNCKIQTQEKGILSKSGSNWVVQSKAKIEFK